MKINKYLYLVIALSLFLSSISIVYANEYTYDNLNRLTKVVYDNGQVITYTYDNGGNLLKVESTNIETDMPTGIIDRFIMDVDEQKIIVPLDGIDGYAFAFSTENELYQYLRGSNEYPVIYGIQSGGKYMLMGGFGGYAMNFSIYPTPLEAMENTDEILVETLQTYYVFNGFDESGNAILTLWFN